MKRLAFVTLFVLLCGIAGTSARNNPTAPVQKTDAVALTANDCLFAAVDGKVDICHATQSASNPFVLITVSVSACVEGHADHEGDVVAVDGECLLP
jgi:hypothetical protein